MRRSICSSLELASAITAQLVPTSRAGTSMRRTIPSLPGAVETWTRPPSVVNRSTASVRSIAAMSTRTLTASTAWTGDVNNDAIKTAAAKATRRTLKRQSSVPIAPLRCPATPDPSEYRTKRISARISRLGVHFGRAFAGGIMPPRQRTSSRRHLHAEHNLTDMDARFHPRMRHGGFPERKDVVHHGAHLTGGNQRPDTVFDRPGNRSLVRDRPRTQRRAGVMQSLEHDAAEIDIGTRRALKCDLNNAALDGRRLVIALDIIAAHHVEDHFGAAAAGRAFCEQNEILGLVVDRDVGAETTAGVAFLGASGCRNDARAECLGELD